MENSTVEFDESGKITYIEGCKNIKRKNGKITSFEYYHEEYDCYFGAEIKYNNDRPSKLFFGTDDGEWNVKFSYNSDGNIIYTISSFPEYGHSFSESYQYLKFDEYGNWTKRRVTDDAYSESNTETRTITYY